MSDSAAELQAGRVGRAHGLDGSFYVTGALPRLLTLGATVTVAGRSAEIVRRSGTDARPIVRLQGVSDRAGAEALRGIALMVAAGGAPQLGEGEWWAHELEHCEVFDGERLLGTVSRMIELPSCEAIEVDSASGGAPCSCRWSETRSARSTPPRGASTSTASSSIWRRVRRPAREPKAAAPGEQGDRDGD